MGMTLTCDEPGRSRGTKPRVLWTAFLLFAFAFAAARVSAQDFEGLVTNSTFVFMGKVAKPGTQAPIVVPAADRTVVIHVETVFRSPKAVGSLAGKDIVLLVKEPRSLTSGKEALFFATGCLLGEGVALREVGHALGITTDEAR